ncbi:hypothetical protein [Komagataeibacter sucrofermentans]|uniref:hypothetical protein n=1 Tax=Komagataeibacter sucrofermentans TaxID=1053551 RepID=UPI00339D33D6
MARPFAVHDTPGITGRDTMPAFHDTPLLPARRGGGTPFEVWVRQSLHARFDRVFTENLPHEILAHLAQPDHGPPALAEHDDAAGRNG